MGHGLNDRRHRLLPSRGPRVARTAAMNRHQKLKLRCRDAIRHRLAGHVKIRWDAVPPPALPECLDLRAAELKLRVTGPRCVMVIGHHVIASPESGSRPTDTPDTPLKIGQHLVPSADQQRVAGCGVGGKLALVPDSAASKKRPDGAPIGPLGDAEERDQEGIRLPLARPILHHRRVRQEGNPRLVLPTRAEV
jgi:hypothetical protein